MAGTLLYEVAILEAKTAKVALICALGLLGVHLKCNPAMSSPDVGTLAVGNLIGRSPKRTDQRVAVQRV